MGQICGEVMHKLVCVFSNYIQKLNILTDTNLFIWGFYVDFNTVQVISQRIVGRAEDIST